MASGEDNYRKGLRNSVYGLWRGVLDKSDFQNAMSDTIERWLTVAWNEGAAECGIGPEELTVDEHRALLSAIDNELGHLSGYADYITQNSKANGGKRETVFRRLENWVRRYKDLTNRAKTMACKDKKLEWNLGATEEHCSTCNKLHGKVKRASYWEAAGLHPQDPPNDRLDCGGWNCLCELRVTDKPISKGPVPGGRGPVREPKPEAPSEPAPTEDYMTWESVDDADAWAKEAYSEWGEGLTQDEIDAIEEYTGFVDDINGKLRGQLRDDEVPGYVGPAIENLDTALEKMSAPTDFVTYREMDPGFLEKLEQGTQFVDNAYTSTSIDPNWADAGFGNHLFEVQVPKGSRGGYLEGYSQVEGVEFEFLLDRGSTFEVVHVGDGTKDNPSVIKVISQREI